MTVISTRLLIATRVTFTLVHRVQFPGAVAIVMEVNGPTTVAGGAGRLAGSDYP